jgi:hypothetical protein
MRQLARGRWYEWFSVICYLLLVTRGNNLERSEVIKIEVKVHSSQLRVESDVVVSSEL